MCSKKVDNKSDNLSNDTNANAQSQDINKLNTSLGTPSSTNQDNVLDVSKSKQSKAPDGLPNLEPDSKDVSSKRQESTSDINTSASTDQKDVTDKTSPSESESDKSESSKGMDSKEMSDSDSSVEPNETASSDDSQSETDSSGDKPRKLKRQKLPVYPPDSPSYEELCAKALEGGISKYELIMLLDKSPGALPIPVIMPAPRAVPVIKKLKFAPLVPPLTPTHMTITSWNEDQREKEIERDKRARGVMDPPQPMSVATSLFARKQLWVRCEGCGAVLYISHLYKYNYTCKDCQDNVRISSFDRISQLIDPDSWRPMFELLSATNPLNFHDKKPYTERLEEAQKRTEIQDAVQTGTGLLGGIPVALGVLAFDFMAGTMGSVVGEKITRLIEYATESGIMLILVSASGGARMQEGALSLVQMAKISGALFNYQNCCKNFYVSVLSSPTTGGVTASFAMLGDIVIAEPKATIGFAGRRVIEQTLGEILPDEFQTAEYLMDHGIVDLIIARNFLKGILMHLCNMSAAAPLRSPGRQFPGHFRY